MFTDNHQTSEFAENVYLEQDVYHDFAMSFLNA